MILALGSRRDTVYPRLLDALRESGHPFAAVDEEDPAEYRVERETAAGRVRYRVHGGECDGSRPVGAIFVRHAVARTLDQEHLAGVAALQGRLNRMLLSTPGPVINRPANAYSNYAKPYQVALLARAGFDVPRSLVTNVPAEARRFAAACDGNVIFKGVSNVLTLAQRLTPENLGRMDLLPHCPTLFQEYVAGVDYRVHVVGERAFVTRLVSSDEDYRRSALVAQEEIVAEPADLPAETLARCVAFTRDQGLILGGLDFKESPAGRLVALECNPYPQFTFYEGRSGQPLTRAVVEYLIVHQTGETNVFA